MKLQEVFDQLTSGELSQLALGGAEAGRIQEADYQKLAAHINLALTAIYKRFYLKEGRIDLSMVEGRAIYPIHNKYAQSNTESNEVVKYLMDTAPNAFLNDILKIESVQTDSGFEIPLNDVTEPLSIATTSPTTLRIPTALVNQGIDLPDVYKTSKLTVVYRANHPVLVYDELSFDPETIELELPESHLEPLLLYIASRCTTPSGMVNEFNAGNNYASKYELACQELEKFNFQIDHSTSNHRLIRNGWV